MGTVYYGPEGGVPPGPITDNPLFNVAAIAIVGAVVFFLWRGVTR
jgi:hypothetical protein